MDSGLVVSPIYQNFPRKRRPPPPPRPGASSETEPPPLPPRMNRETQPSLSGSRTHLDQEPSQCDVSAKEKHRIQVIPLGKQQDEDVRVDTSKMNFKDLMTQWKNSSPREISSTSDLRRQEQKIIQKPQPTNKLITSVPTTLERTRTPTSIASTYRHDPAQKQEATSPVTTMPSALSSSLSISPFATSPSTAFAPTSFSEPPSLPYRHLGGQSSALYSRSSTMYPGASISSSSIDVTSTHDVAYTDDFSNATVSNNGYRIAPVNQNSPFNTAQTPTFGRISFMAYCRSRSSSDLVSDQLPDNQHASITETAPIKLHRLLRDRSSSDHDILSDKFSQRPPQYQHPFKPPPDGTALAFSRLQSAGGDEAESLKSPLTPHGEEFRSKSIADGRHLNSTLELPNGYEITGDSHGFADECYIGHKNKSSRTFGTYKRSVSAAGVQSANNTQGKASGNSDSTPFRESRLGQQSWNSDSLLPGTGHGVKTLSELGSEVGTAHTDGNRTKQGVSSATPVRPPRPNARGRQAKQISTTASSNVSQKTKLASVSLSALDSLATSASFSVEHHSNVNQKESHHRAAPPTPPSPPYDPNQQDHWPMQQASLPPSTLPLPGQGLDRRPVNNLQHSQQSPQHRKQALNDSLNNSPSRVLVDNNQSQSTFIQGSTTKSLSPRSPNELVPVHIPARDCQRRDIDTGRVMTSATSLENTPTGLTEDSAFSSHYRSDHQASSPREPRHKSSSTPTLSHVRQPSQEEIECDEKVLELAEELDENDQKLLEVLKQDRLKKRMLYMDGLFDHVADDRDKSSFNQKSRCSLKNRTLDRALSNPGDASGSFKSYSLPRDYQQTPSSKAVFSTEVPYGANSSPGTSPSGVHENLTVMKRKEELVEKLHRKIMVLKEEKLSLQQEIADNILLGQQVCQVADSRCQTQNEKEKFMTFIDDLEKIVRLLLNLSGQLARAENAVQALCPEADAKLKKLTWDKRERLHAKLEEAKLLKEAVDRRSEQLFGMLQERLSAQELSDYKHFVTMKSRLTIEMQVVDDHLALAEQQIVALKRSLPGSAVSFPGKYGEA